MIAEPNRAEISLKRCLFFSKHRSWLNLQCVFIVRAASYKQNSGFNERQMEVVCGWYGIGRFL